MNFSPIMFYITPKIPASTRQYCEASAVAWRRGCSVLPSVPSQSPSAPARTRKNTVCPLLTLHTWSAQGRHPQTLPHNGAQVSMAGDPPLCSAPTADAWLQISVTAAHPRVWPNIPLIIWATTVLTQSLRDFGHVKASSCTMTEGNSAIFSSFISPFKEHPRLYVTGLGSHLICFPPNP